MKSELSPAQAALRFGLEVTAMVAWAMAAWRAMPGTLASVVGSVGAVVVLAGLWGTFRVTGDASASGGAPVAVGGRTRLALELCLLLGAAVAAILTANARFGAVLGALVMLHYATTPRRVRWLLER
ncbi:DUF2568 domain-containing protein [Acidimicrobiia bacterium EGI L10123]|uniref:DUF2568 domain-containing protein n=1 Tax=Salinilacustrithrix flava TaxID=2957203 RepID=UPI003D7C2A2B|nr:DUF2568 domain-containing protein [Acidimicrobiia bacterium EGI L10123]